MSDQESSLHALMSHVGPRWRHDIQGHIAAVVDAYSALHAALAPADIRFARDIAYGPHPRHRLDVYAPARVDAAVPVVLFVHGGGFVDGEKDRTPQVHSNVCRYFARRGIVAVNMSYRLAPEALFPSGTDDVAAAAGWVRQHISEWGGDANRLFLMGHSAGATHAGLYAYGAPTPAGLAGLIVVSGRVRCDASALNPAAARVQAYFGMDAQSMEDRMEEGSVVNHVTPACVPTLIALAEYENPLIDVYCAELYHRLAQAQGRAPRLIWLPGHNHASIIAHIGTAEDYLGSQLCAFIASVPASP